MIGILLNVVHFSGPQKNIKKESDGFHNHSTQLTMVITNEEVEKLRYVIIIMKL